MLRRDTPSLTIIRAGQIVQLVFGSIAERDAYALRTLGRFTMGATLAHGRTTNANDGRYYVHASDHDEISAGDQP